MSALLTTDSAARIFHAAAGLIRDQGYTPDPEPGAWPGQSADSAICEVIHPGEGGPNSGHHPDACDEAHARFAGWLYLTGQIGGHTADLTRVDICSRTAAWEMREPPPGLDRVCAALELAARAIEQPADLADDAPEPCPGCGSLLAYSHGPRCTVPGVPRGRDYEPEPAEYDPGPEVDDQGGMSEYRPHEPEPWT